MERINVTKTFLPPREEYDRYLDQIWASGQLTNQGPLLHKFEYEAEQYLELQNFQFVSNGTIALQVALRALNITEGEVITTPFSYVATTSAILWERCKPVFVDIEPDTFCIDVAKIEAAITKNTKAIMAVHVFGNPCDVEAIDAIARKHGLKVIYDAAHAFGVKFGGKSLLDNGDISTCSFHSTKVFHTIEGGCVIAREQEVSDRVELIKRFGHTGDEHFTLGINAKASEFQAAMGLCNLAHIDKLINERRKLFKIYDGALPTQLPRPKINSRAQHNYGYYPVVFRNEDQLLGVMAKLAETNVFPRRYFYPSLNELPYLNNPQDCPVSEDISRRIVCLPFYAGLESERINNICEVISECL